MLMKTVCLNMIVKNESHVIKRCLESIKPVIDYWVIFDTGSTDGTQQMIREILKDIPGELHESLWVNFEHNRNVALNAARNKADYLFFFDADEELVLEKPFDKASWDKDFYMLKAKGEMSDFFHPNIVSNDPGWHWVGVLHECITHTRKMDGEILLDVHVNRPQDGARSKDPEKHMKDIAILQEAMRKEPWNARHVFYLAQTYAAAKDLPLALKYYEKRALMEGDDDESFWNLFRLGCLLEVLDKDPLSIAQAHCRAHQKNTYRAEPLERLSNFYNRNKCHSIAYAIAKFGIGMKMPTALNSDFYPWVYEYGMLAQLADAAFALGFYDEAEEHYKTLRGKTNLPENSTPYILKQLQKIKQKKAESPQKLYESISK